MRIEEVGGAILINADCRVAMAAMDENSVDSIVCDPPYGLSFMGKGWDHGVPGVEFWAAALRVAKPGAYLLAFGGTRTHHRLMVAIEDAGWEIRDVVMWVYGSGFPKSLDVSKAIDKAGGIDTTRFKADLRKAVENSGKTRTEIDAACGFTMRFDTPYDADPIGWGVSLPSAEKWEVIAGVLGINSQRWVELIGRVWRGRAGGERSQNTAMNGCNFDRHAKGDPATDAAKQWQGWGTALKPAWEPIILARKPLIGTVAGNVQQFGTGGLNIDGCRIEGVKGTPASPRRAEQGAAYSDLGNDPGTGSGWDVNVGRWPANLIHDGSEEVLAAFPNNNLGCKPHVVNASPELAAINKAKGWGSVSVPQNKLAGYDDDSTSAARFFYCAKASRTDRNEGCENLPLMQSGMVSNTSGQHITRRDGNAPGPAANNHPTVKPTALMQYLCRLITPPNGTILDPFMGSGSTGKAALKEGFKFVGIELDEEHGYFDIAYARIKAIV